MTDEVLVIKLGALGDLVLATGPFAAIRAHHPDARVTLLTTPPFADFMVASGWFDTVWPDGRPRDLPGWLRLLRRLRRTPFDWIYDLQTSDRTAIYFRLLRRAGGQPPNWSGIARGCSHPHADPARDTMHTLQRQADQLAVAGITAVPPPDLSWAAADIPGLALPPRYAVFAVGGSADRPDKRWPARHYAALAARAADRGITPVLVGTSDDVDAARAVAADCPAAHTLIGRTTLTELATVARGAVAAVGNDTGPIHVAAATGVPTVALFSTASDPALCAPVGPHVTVLRADPLSDLQVDKVEAALRLG